MIKLSMDEIRAKQIDILKFVVHFCEKNDIKYWLDSGTMLGAVRHKGYIPWDDDIDLGMLREDYDIFIRTFNESGGKYYLDCIEINPQSRFPFAKVFDSTTILYEEDIELSINIDVFVYDNAPSKKTELRWMYFKRDVFNRMNNWQWGNGVLPSSIVKRFIRRIFVPICKCFPKNYFCKEIINNSRKYVNQKTSYVGNFTSVSKVLLNKDYLSTMIKCSFEGGEYFIPIGYDKWLKQFYGDYMKLPPEQDRVGKHHITAYLR